MISLVTRINTKCTCAYTNTCTRVHAHVHVHVHTHLYCSGAGLNTGCYGRILAGFECTQASYPVTLALLELLSTLVQVSDVT